MLIFVALGLSWYPWVRRKGQLKTLSRFLFPPRAGVPLLYGDLQTHAQTNFRRAASVQDPLGRIASGGDRFGRPRFAAAHPRRPLRSPSSPHARNISTQARPQRDDSCTFGAPRPQSDDSHLFGAPWRGNVGPGPAPRAKTPRPARRAKKKGVDHMLCT